MPGNGKRGNNDITGDISKCPPRLPRWVTRRLPSALVAGCLTSAALGLAACAGPASSHGLAASPRTVSVRSSAPTRTLPAPLARAARSTPAAASRNRHGTAAATSRTQPSTAAATPGTRPSAASRHLAPVRLPAHKAESWTAQTAGPVRDVTGHDIELNECATVHGAATWQQQPYMSSGGNSAILETFTFATSAAARSASAAVLSGMRSCQATSRALQATSHILPDAVSRRTASATGAAAFERTWTGVMGISAGGPQINHLYLAARGTTVLILHFDELGKQTSPYDVRNDPGVLSALSNVLTA
jgi:hypothetical protein